MVYPIAFCDFSSGWPWMPNRWESIVATALTSSLFLSYFQWTWVLEPLFSSIGAFILCILYSIPHSVFVLQLETSYPRSVRKWVLRIHWFPPLFPVDRLYGSTPSFLLFPPYWSSDCAWRQSLPGMSLDFPISAQVVASRKVMYATVLRFDSCWEWWMRPLIWSRCIRIAARESTRKLGVD